MDEIAAEARPANKTGVAFSVCACECICINCMHAYVFVFGINAIHVGVLCALAHGCVDILQRSPRMTAGLEKHTQLSLTEVLEEHCVALKAKKIRACA